MPDDARIRHYRDDDAGSWLRCRLLSFFSTQYYDDVVTDRPRFGNPAICMVAEINGYVAGLLDAEIFDSKATIDVLAVHPDHRRQGIATGLLQAVTTELKARNLESLDAWTREDVPANRWYRRSGFTEEFRYLHIHKSGQDDVNGFETPQGLSRPIKAFMHAPVELESTLRARFRRVYICRRYVKPLSRATA